MLEIAFLLYPHALASSVALPAEMLHAADHFYRVKFRRRPLIRTRVVDTASPVPALAGSLRLHADCGLEELGPLQLLVLPAMWRDPLAVVRSHPEVVTAVRKQHAAGAAVCSVGTGSCFVAEAGLLDGKPATTHWFFMDRFAERYPAVQLQRKHLITRADNLYCAGSVNAVADLTGHFIERFFGPTIARQVEAQFSPEIRRSYHALTYIEGQANRHDDELIAEAQQWLHGHFSESIDFGELATRIGISQRSFNRRFRNATGSRPGAYLQRLRLEQARDLLRNSNLAITEIAQQVGYQDASHFAALFRERMSQTPLEYRRSARGKLFSPEI